VQIIRTLAFILLACGLLIFSFYNWRPVEVTIWENLVLETKVPVVLILAFLIGLVPLLAYHLSVKWRLKRRIRNLENSLKTLATTRRTDSSESGMVPVTVTSADSKKPDTPDTGADSNDSGGGGDGGAD
jgi:hypothetical protein